MDKFLPGYEFNSLLATPKQKEVQETWPLPDITLNGSCSDIEKKAKKLGNDKLVSMYTMALIKDNKSLDFLPNYVTLKNGEQIDKAEYADMVIMTEAYIRANGRLPAIVYRMSKLPDYNDSTMKLFIKTFNFKGNTIDEALAVIAKKRLYSKYFDSQNWQENNKWCQSE